MNRTITREEFYTVAKILTKDAFAFLESEKGKDWKQAGYPAYNYRYIHIQPRRDIGKSYAAARLAADYAPTLFVFHSLQQKHDAVNRHRHYNCCPTNPDYAFTVDEILQDKFLPALDHVQRIRRLPPTADSSPSPRFKLGIIEDGGACAGRYPLRLLDEARDRMFTCCDVVLEFG